MMNRRGFLGRVIGAAIAAPVAAQEAMAGIGQGSGLGILDVAAANQAIPMAAGSAGPSVLPRAAAVAKVLGDPTLLQLVRKMAQQRVPDVITALDPDLAANRSFSLSTKIRLQRERLVERRYREILSTETSIWQQLYEKGIDL